MGAYQTTHQRHKIRVGLWRAMDGHGAKHWLNKERVYCACGEENLGVVHMTFRCERRLGQGLAPPEHPWEGEYLVTTRQGRQSMRANDDELYATQIHTAAENIKHRRVGVATDGGARRCAIVRGVPAAAATFATDPGTDTIGMRLGGIDDSSFAAEVAAMIMCVEAMAIAKADREIFSDNTTVVDLAALTIQDHRFIPKQMPHMWRRFRDVVEGRCMKVSWVLSHNKQPDWRAEGENSVSRSHIACQLNDYADHMCTELIADEARGAKLLEERDLVKRE